MEVHGKSQSGYQHLACILDVAEKSHIFPFQRDDQIRATPMHSPQSKAPELSPKYPFPHKHTLGLHTGSVLWGLQKMREVSS